MLSPRRRSDRRLWGQITVQFYDINSSRVEDVNVNDGDITDAEDALNYTPDMQKTLLSQVTISII